MAGKHDCCCSFALPGRKYKSPVPPKAAREGTRVKPEMGVMALHRKCRIQIFYLSRVAGFFFFGFFGKLRKRK